MFQVKICGVTTPEDALMAADAGADAIGLNFFAKSPRYLSPDAARVIAEAVRGRVTRVGVFVNSSLAEVRTIASHVGLDIVQLHGDEPPELAADLTRILPVLKAFRIGPEGWKPVTEYLDRLRSLGGLVRQVLFDAREPGHYGGTGKTADWDTLKDYPQDGRHPPFVLAGGLTPENVAKAILWVHPCGVDTASGVEQSPGRKDPVLVARFVSEVKATLGERKKDEG
jgi:phosphoribosylanthranilate isomerase